MRTLFVIFMVKNCLLSALLFAMLSIKLEPLSDGYYIIVVTTLSGIVVGLTWCETLITRWIVNNLDKKG